MKCVNCGFENNEKNKYCLSCGKKIKKNNNIGSKVCLIILIVLKIIEIIIAINIIEAAILCVGIYGMFDSLSDWSNSVKVQQEEENNMYEEIANEVINKGLGLSNLKQVGYNYKNIGWTSDGDRWETYINEDDYDNYKHYWLEDVSEDEKKLGYNSNLYDHGDYVFTGIKFMNLSYIKDVDYGNVHLTANIDYYLVKVYDKVLYYKYIDDKYNFIYSNILYEEDSLVKKFIVHKENDEWIMEELIME